MTITPESDTAFALLHPDGTLEWKPLSAEADVRVLVNHGVQGTEVIRWIGSAQPDLRLMASDIGALSPAEYPANPAAQRVLERLSHGYVMQPWAGLVVLCTCDEDGYPQELTTEQVQKITAVHAAS